MEYTIRKCNFTAIRDKKNDLIEEAFQAAGFTYKDADEFLEIDHMEKLYTKGNVTVRFVLMDNPDEFKFNFQYHVFENYSDEIARKKEKMKKLHLQKQNETPKPNLKSIGQEVRRTESFQEELVVAATSNKTEEIDKQLFVENGDKYVESELTNNINHEINEEVAEGQFSIFDM